MAQLSQAEAESLISTISELIAPSDQERMSGNFTTWLGKAETAGLINHEERGQVARYLLGRPFAVGATSDDPR